MALSTYSELKASVADWLNRSDLTSVIADFIALAESKFNRTIRTRDMVQRATATLDSQYTQLPGDFLEMINLQLNTTTPVKLSFLSNEQADDYRTAYYAPSGQPKYYSIVGQTFEVVPTPDTDTYTAEMSYYKTIPALSDGNTSNWLLLKSPSLYLYGALLQSAPYLQEDNRIATWAGLYQNAFDDLMLEEQRSKFSGTTPRVRARSLG
jgi:hypothetical protein